MKDINRLKLHIQPSSGWINDPNGLCQLNGIVKLGILGDIRLTNSSILIIIISCITFLPDKGRLLEFLELKVFPCVFGPTKNS